jgi:hypothetical protein
MAGNLRVSRTMNSLGISNSAANPFASISSRLTASEDRWSRRLTRKTRWCRSLKGTRRGCTRRAQTVRRQSENPHQGRRSFGSVLICLLASIALICFVSAFAIVKNGIRGRRELAVITEPIVSKPFLIESVFVLYPTVHINGPHPAGNIGYFQSSERTVKPKPFGKGSSGAEATRESAVERDDNERAFIGGVYDRHIDDADDFERWRLSRIFHRHPRPRESLSSGLWGIKSGSIPDASSVGEYIGTQLPFRTLAHVVKS